MWEDRGVLMVDPLTYFALFFVPLWLLVVAYIVFVRLEKRE